MKVDVRIVAATNRDLPRAVEEGRFRADLYYRLAVFCIAVPPLRERRRDCAVLAEAFVRAQGRRLGKELRGLAPRALDRLASYAWPGNVRELRNVIERAAIVAAGPTLEDGDVPPLGGVSAVTRVDADAGAATGEGDARLETVERAHILRILERTGWTIEGAKGAASVLGMAPSTLRSRMAQLSLRRPKAKK